MVGMTGSGKTGLVTILVEEALRNDVPVLVVDVKGDLPNLLLGFSDFDAASIEPWIEAPANVTARDVAVRCAEERSRAARRRANSATS